MTAHPETVPLFKQTDAELGYGGYRPVLNQNQPTVAQDDISVGADFNALRDQGNGSLCLSTTSFIFCFFGSIVVLGATVICHIPAMLFAAKSRLSAEKKDYYDSKLMLHWSYICTFAGCFIGWVIFAVGIVFLIAGGTTASSR